MEQVGRRHVLGRPLPGLSGAQILAHPQSISDPATTCRHLPYCGYRRQTYPLSSDREPLPVQYQNLRTIYTICIADTRAHCPFSDYTMLWKPSVLLLLLLLLLSFFEIEIESLLSLHMQATTRCALLTPLDLTGWARLVPVAPRHTGLSSRPSKHHLRPQAHRQSHNHPADPAAANAAHSCTRSTARAGRSGGRSARASSTLCRARTGRRRAGREDPPGGDLRKARARRVGCVLRRVGSCRQHNSSIQQPLADGPSWVYVGKNVIICATHGSRLDWHCRQSRSSSRWG